MNSDEEFHDTTQDLDESSEENGIDRDRISGNLVDFMGTLVSGKCREDIRFKLCKLMALFLTIRKEVKICQFTTDIQPC